MKKSGILNVGAVTLCLSMTQGCLAKMTTQKQKLGYAIGQQVGETIKNQGLEVDVDSLAKSVEDVIGGKTSQLTQEEMRLVMKTAFEETQKKMAKDAEENIKKGTEFLEANKKKPGIIVTASGLQYKVVTEGTGESPKDEDSVKCHYAGRLINGTEFDSSYARKEPAEFPVKGVIAGWTEALKTMKKGEKRELYIPSDLAYGPGGRPGIPPNSVLVFDIELLEINKAAAAPKAPTASKTKAPATPKK